MRDIRIAAAQFEHKNADREYNLGRIRELTARAVEQGAEIGVRLATLDDDGPNAGFFDRNGTVAW